MATQSAQTAVSQAARGAKPSRSGRPNALPRARCGEARRRDEVDLKVHKVDRARPNQTKSLLETLHRQRSAVVCCWAGLHVARARSTDKHDCGVQRAVVAVLRVESKDHGHRLHVPESRAGVHSTAGRGPKQQHTEHRQSSAVDHTAATNARPGLAELLRPIRDTPDPDVERFEPIRTNVRTHMSGAMYSLTTP